MGPSLKIYFENEVEHQIVQREAALNGIPAQQLVLQCVRKTLNDIFLARKAELDARKAAEAAQSVEAAPAADMGEPTPGEVSP